MEEQTLLQAVNEPETRLKWFRRHRYYFYLPLIAIFGIAAALSHYYAVSQTPTDYPITKHRVKAVRIDTGKWQVYKNDTIGLEFSYPADKFLLNGTDAKTVSKLVLQDKSLINGPDGGWVMTIDKRPNPNNLTPNAYFNANLKKNNVGDPTVVNGAKAVVYNASEGLAQEYTLFTNESNAFIVSIDQNRDDVESVVGTIKVAQPKTVNAVTAKPELTGQTAIERFAQCLQAEKATMYGASWCSHCQNEKKSFGTAWRFVPYVECADNPKACQAAGIEGYPTWVIKGGQRLFGEQNGDGFKKLAEATGCPADVK